MKILAMLSAGLIAATVAIPAATSAQMHSERVTTRTVVHTERHSGYGNRTRRVCKVTYHNHRRVRTCRTVRR